MRFQSIETVRQSTPLSKPFETLLLQQDRVIGGIRYSGRFITIPDDAWLGIHHVLYLDEAGMKV